MSCERCDELVAVIARLEDANAELGRQLAGTESNMRRIGSENVALRAELTKTREDEDGSPEAKRLLKLWRDLYRDGNKRVNIDLTEARGKRMKWALKKFGAERVENAIKGIEFDDWMMGRHPQTKGSKPLPNDIKLAFKDVEWFERCEAAWENRASRFPAVEGPTGVQALLDKLDQVKEAKPGQWTARCPAHEDRNASLSVGQGRKGAVVHCHTGCSVDEIAHAVGLGVGSLFDRDDAPTKLPMSLPDPLPTGAELAAMQSRLQHHTTLLDRIYELRGWTAATLLQAKVGFDGRRLQLPVFNAQGELVNVLGYLPARKGNEPKLLAIKGRPRDLFPGVPDGDVWVVEGEPDALTMLELGISAVGLPGTNGWRDEYAQRFVGRRVVVCMDCDEPGRKTAERVGHALLSTAREVKVVDLAPDRADGWDVSDMLRDRPEEFSADDHARLLTQTLLMLADDASVFSQGVAA